MSADHRDHPGMSADHGDGSDMSADHGDGPDMSGARAREDRKALIREYKKTPRPMGVFRVLNMRTGRCLLGASIDVTSILNRHRAQLRMGGHPVRELQRDWNALGPDAFAFEVVDTLQPAEDPAHDPADDLRALEALWLEHLEACGGESYR